jgi:hypothetical protein
MRPLFISLRLIYCSRRLSGPALPAHLILPSMLNSFFVQMNTRAHSLSGLTDHVSHATGVRRGDLNPGDVLMLYTLNSVYSARFLNNGMFAVSGGWFDSNHSVEVLTTIAGCTWGGKCIHQDLVASPGMRVEFGNRVLTSVLQRVVKIPGPLLN